MSRSITNIERVSLEAIYLLPPVSMAITVVDGKLKPMSGMLPLNKERFPEPFLMFAGGEKVNVRPAIHRQLQINLVGRDIGQCIRAI